MNKTLSLINHLNRNQLVLIQSVLEQKLFRFKKYQRINIKNEFLNTLLIQNGNLKPIKKSIQSNRNLLKDRPIVKHLIKKIPELLEPLGLLKQSQLV